MMDIASIPLSGRNGEGKSMLVDAEDVPLLSTTRWHFANGYAVGNAMGKLTQPARLWMTPLPGFELDHINRNKLDNRRCNIRACTHSENMRNRDPIPPKPGRRLTAKMTVQIEPEVYAKMASLAESSGRTVGSCIRRAMADWMQLADEDK